MEEQTIEISGITIDDLDILQAISIQTFTETFSEQNTESDMQTYIAENLSKERLIKEINFPGSNFYFIKSEHKVIGYLKTNSGEAQTEKQPGNALEIERIYVVKEFHGKYIGKLLLNKAIAIARQQQCRYIWLGVWEENKKAISFYEKNGFTVFDKHLFKLGADEQTDLLMKLELN